MRILKSRRGVDGFNYHTCPDTGENVRTARCEVCPQCDHIEHLEATYRIHCRFDAADELPQIKPAKAAAKIPRSLGTDPLKLASHTLLEPKLDGVRIFMHIGVEGNRLTTRRKSRGGLYNEVTDQLPHLRELDLGDFPGTVLDGEIMMPAFGASSGSLGSTMSVIGASPEKARAYQEKWGYVGYQVFDVPFFRERDYRKIALYRRRKALDILWRETDPSGFLQPVWYQELTSEVEKAAFVQKCLSFGYEGAVLKNLDAAYYDLRAWIKIKEKHTLDLQIVDWKPGKAGGKHEGSLGSLVMAVGTHGGSVLEEVTTVSPGTDVQRSNHEFLMDLEPLEILGECLIAEVEFQNWTKEYRLRHPRVLRYRHDRSEPSIVDFATVKRS